MLVFARQRGARMDICHGTRQNWGCCEYAKAERVAEHYDFVVIAGVSFDVTTYTPYGRVNFIGT